MDTNVKINAVGWYGPEGNTMLSTQLIQHKSHRAHHMLPVIQTVIQHSDVILEDGYKSGVIWIAIHYVSLDTIGQFD